MTADSGPWFDRGIVGEEELTQSDAAEHESRSSAAPEVAQHGPFGRCEFLLRISRSQTTCTAGLIGLLHQ